MSTEETPLDVQIRLLEKNLNEVKKRTQIINLENEILRQEQELSAAQARLDATKSSGLALSGRPPAAALTSMPDGSTSQAVTEFIDAVRSTIPLPLPGGDSDRDQSGISAPVEEEVRYPEAEDEGIGGAEVEDENGADETATAHSDLQSAPMDTDDAGSSGDLDDGDLADASSDHPDLGDTGPGNAGPDHRDLNNGDLNDEHHSDEYNNDHHMDADVDGTGDAQGNDISMHSVDEESSEGESASTSSSTCGEESTLEDETGESTPPARPPQLLSFHATPVRINTSPPKPKVPYYRGESWPECKKFISIMESHFAQYKSYYTEARKVGLGAHFLADEVKDNWHHYVVNLKQGTTWDSYCVFLAQQLLRECGPGKAFSIFKSRKQKIHESVSEFALWLKRWAPALSKSKQHSRDSYFVALANGNLEPLRYKAKKSYEEFGDDYFGFARYLQGLEDSMPKRRKLLKRPDPDADDASSNSGATQHKSQFETFPKSPAQTTHRSPSPSIRRGSPLGRRNCRDESPPVQQNRRFSPAPPEPAVRNLYEGKSWCECKNLIGNLEAWFARYPAWYTHARKVKLGVRYFSKEMIQRWLEYCASLTGPSWIAYCIFLVRQLPPDAPSLATQETYHDSKQKETESVLDFALFLQRQIPHF